ncbi:MAG: hypothetical protein LBE13_16130 [Bacteroidales bacterium]|jgi:hypothetical protein|nr:hypothetical protein [Bacteroidales bacterium]
MKDSYSNPFNGVNAAQLDDDAILNYWCDPFGYLSEITEEDIFNDNTNIVLMGGRSTGKSMFLRYWSYPVQIKLSKNYSVSFKETIKKNNGIGFYFRIDGAKLKSFQGHGLDLEHWTSVFTHYVELVIGRQYIEFLNSFSSEDSQSEEIQNLIPKICELLSCQAEQASLETIIEDLDAKVREVEIYLGNVPFYKEQFKPKDRGFLSQSLSFGIPELLFANSSFFKDLNIVILLDEYENFLKNQQKVINTLLRFTKSNIKFRIGMRLEGFRTFEMISEDDFIKEGREYRKVVFEEVVNKNSDYQNFLFEISKKRLESIPILREKNFIDIRIILGTKEDLEQEAIELVSKQPDAIEKYYAKKISKENFDKIKYPANPLLELMNCMWISTRKKTPEETVKAMNDYLSGNNSEEGHKYKRDYIDKYKLSLMFLLCSIYHKNKQYYSFNTFSFLSSGIVGHFIELCRRAFAQVGWSGIEVLLETGVIDRKLQNIAATEFSNSEKQQVGRIETYGGVISKFVDNIGNIFREYHKDVRIKYPETNQFAINIDSIQDKELQNAIKAAINWSIIQRKPRMQLTSPSENLQDIYTLNRIFSPTFQISYRTRGGKSIVIDAETLRKLMLEEKIKISEYIPSDKLDLNKEKKIPQTPNLFPDYE